LSHGRYDIVLPDDGAKAREKRRRRGIVRRWTELAAKVRERRVG
jgi:hypothetical protein